MDTDTLLYALSTLAQTCAALAAFVGAVGIYRLTVLHGERQAVYEDLYAQLGRPTKTKADVMQQAREQAKLSPPIAENVTLLDGFPSRLRRVVLVLILFELWQLGSILFALWSFYYVKPPSQSVVTLFFIASIGAVITAIISIVFWTVGGAALSRPR